MALAGETSATSVAHLYALLGDEASAAALIDEAVKRKDPIIGSPLYFFLPEDWLHMPAIKLALESAGMDQLFEFRRASIQAGTGRVLP